MNEIDEILANIDIDEKDKLSLPSDARNAGDKAAASFETPPGSIEDIIPAVEPAETEITVDEIPDVEIPVSIERQEAPAIAKIEEFLTRGTKTWNTREPYIIKINAEAIQKERTDLYQSFYYIEKPTDSENIKLKIKQEIVKFLRKPNDSISERYSDFIYKSVIINLQNISNDFELNQNNEKLFIYHVGPLTLYRILKEEFINKKYGFCYKYLPGNKAVRYFPAEFIKESILKWFVENINILDLPFDSIQKYEEMRNIAQKKYQNDLRIFNMRLDQLNAKIEANKTISRNKLIQLKGNQWFGFQNIEIYKRFLGAAIFI